MQVITTKISILASVAISIVLFMAGGCSSTVPKPVGELASADTALSQAEYSGAGTYAPVELERAHTKLSEAYAEFKEENFRQATRLANEALVDANLAIAKANAVKTTKAAKAMEESVSLLEESLKQNRTR